MRYRANTRLKGAPKHRAAPAVDEAKIQRTAEIMHSWSFVDPSPWEELLPIVQLAWLEEAEIHLVRKRKGLSSSHACCL